MLTRILKRLAIEDVSQLDNLYSELDSIAFSGNEPSKELKDAVEAKEFTYEHILPRLPLENTLARSPHQKFHSNDTKLHPATKTIMQGHFNIFQFLIDNELVGRDYTDILTTVIQVGRLYMVDYLIKKKSDKIPSLDDVLIHAAKVNQLHIVHYLINNKLVELTPKTALRCLNSYIQLTEELPHTFIQTSDELKQCNKITGYIVTISFLWPYFVIPADDKSTLIRAANAGLINGFTYLDKEEASKDYFKVKDTVYTPTSPDRFTVLKKVQRVLSKPVRLDSSDIPIVKFLCEHKEIKYTPQELRVYYPPIKGEFYSNCYLGKIGGTLSNNFLRMQKELESTPEYQSVRKKLHPNYQGTESKESKEVKSESDYPIIIETIDHGFIESELNAAKYLISRILAKKYDGTLSQLSCSDCLQYYIHQALYKVDKNKDENNKTELFTLAHFIESGPISEYAIIYALYNLMNDLSVQSDHATEEELQLKVATHVSHYITATKSITNDMTHWVYSRILSGDFCPEDTINLIENSFLQPLLLTLLNEGNLAISPILVNIIFEYTGNLRLLMLFCCLYGKEEGIQQLQALYEKNQRLIEHKSSKNTLSTSSTSTAVVTPAILDEKKQQSSENLHELIHEHTTSPEIPLPEQATKFKKFLYLLSTSLSEKSNSTQKGNCLRKYREEAKNIEFTDQASLENALRNVIALALQRDRNSWSFFSTTTSGYAVLDLLRCTEYSAFAALVYNGPPAKMTYANLRTFVLGFDDKSYFYTRNKTAMYGIHQKEGNTLTSKNMTVYLKLKR